MSRIKIGTVAGDGALSIDLDRLRETRLFIQAASGGGKTWAVRKILEECYGKIQIIVLDAEDDFNTLREKHDFILAGEGGDIPAEPRSAELLARKTLELETSLIVNLFEMTQKDRELFVQHFLTGLIDAPKDLWHPVLVVVDEVHMFAPESGRAVSGDAVAALATRGRKRGFVGVFATQRISEVSKAVVAQCRNKLIGVASLDLDMKRSANELGFDKKAQLTLRDLDSGEFYAFGPAISKQVVKSRIGAVKTTHFGSGHRFKKQRSKPLPTGRIKSILAKLTDLPAEAEAELRDLEALRTRVRELERELKKRPDQVDPEKLRAIEATAYAKGQKDTMKQISTLKNQLLKQYQQLGILIEQLPVEVPASAAPARGPAYPLTIYPKPEATTYVPPAAAARTPAPDIEGRKFGACERKVLGFLSRNPGVYFTRVQVAVKTGYAHSSGNFGNALSNLSGAGLISRQANSVALIPGAKVDGLVDPNLLELADWRSKLGSCERKVFETLLHQADTEWARDDIAHATGYVGSSGNFGNALSRLSGLGLLKRIAGGRVRLNPEVADL